MCSAHIFAPAVFNTQSFVSEDIKMPRAHLCAFPSIKAKQRALNFKFLKFREKQSGRLSQRIKLLYNI